jgi:filamentous hemagglutinin family protein
MSDCQSPAPFRTSAANPPDRIDFRSRVGLRLRYWLVPLAFRSARKDAAVGYGQVRRSGVGRKVHTALLGGVSLLAIMLANNAGRARNLNSAGPIAATAAAQQAAIAAAQQAAGAAAQAQASLSRAAAALAAARKLQVDSAAAAQASSVPNGVITGGLMPFGGTDADPMAGIKADPSKWIGASAPTQTSNGSQVEVDIQQNQQKALLYWNTFNVGASTTVNFNQQQSNWIAFNRVTNSTSPTQILGHVNALGSVYIINNNGIIFGAGSQVNVNTLVASSLDIGKLGSDLPTRDSYFLNTGITNLNSFSFYDPATQGSAMSNAVAGDIVVQRGASITANVRNDVVSTGSPGDVYLFGANVTNHGWISAPVGEVGMVAARTIDLVPNGYSVLKDASGKPLQFRGTEFSISPFASSYQGSSEANPGYPKFAATYLAGTGVVKHDGLIETPAGIAIMNGDAVTIDNPRDASGNTLTSASGALVQGVISADTAIDRNSFVMLRGATSVTMNGVITSLPFDDGASPLPTGGSTGSTVQSFTPAYIEMSAQGAVTVGSSGLVSAPSANVSLRAIGLNNDSLYSDTSNTGTGATGTVNRFHQFSPGLNDDTGSPSASAQTVLLSPGATIDVSGLENVTLPATYNFVSFAPRAEFADMPLQRNGPLYGQTLWIDIRASGTRSDGTSWVGTPLADASGYVAAVGRSIYQLMTTGGSVNLQTDLGTNSGGGRVQTAGSVINVAGGSVNFLPGMVPTTRLLGIDGHIYSMANADPNMTYVGIAGQFTVDHSRWGIKETWSTGTQTFSPGYTDGQAAGSVTVTTVNPSLLGTMYFGSVAGQRQIANGQLPNQGSLSLTTPSSVQVGPAPSADYITTSASTTLLSADTLSGYGLSSLSITSNDLVVSSGSTLNLAAGGGLTVLTGGAIDIAGTVSAAGGSISLTTDRVGVGASTSSPFGSGQSLLKPPTDKSGKAIVESIFVEGTLDVSGRFVNDTGRFGSDMTGPAFINGGTISITTNKTSDKNRVDRTGSIILAKGSRLDVSSGGYISPLGKPKTTSSGVMAGKAGSITLAIDQGPLPWNNPSDTPDFNVLPATGSTAFIELDGNLRGYGFQSNGSLTLIGVDTMRIGGTLQAGETSGIRIRGVASTMPVALLTSGGFGSYAIESVSDGWTGAAANVIVSAGANITLQQQNLASTADIAVTPTGTKFSQQATPAVAQLPDDQRQATNLTLKADNITLDTGSTIVTDPGAKIVLSNIDLTQTIPTVAQNAPAKNVTLKGTIVDHGGSVFINSLKTRLASQALVDVSGTFVANSRFGLNGGPLTSGTYLAGGSFTVEAGQLTRIGVGLQNSDTTFNSYAFDYGAPAAGTYVEADAGAQVDVSGAAGNIQVAGARGATSLVWSWSDAGTVSVDAIGFAWGGSFAATGGRYVGADGQTHADSRANNGTVILGGGAMQLRQDTTDVNAAVAAFKQGLGQAPQGLFVSANQLAPFDNVYLYAAAGQGGAARIFTDLPGNFYSYGAPGYSTLTISGALNWNVASRLHIAAGAITAGPSVNAQLSASYVELTGGTQTTASGSSTLTITAQTIDLEGAAFSGFKQVNLLSSGDLRLSTPKVADGVFSGTNTAPNDTSRFSGSLTSSGDLLLSAQRIYPVSAVDFTIKTPGNVKFAAPAGSNASIPLSAGGSLTVLASTIDQGGNLFAPLGTITLGNTDTTVSSITTQSVVLEAGSLTSVSLADTTVPFGATLDGDNWYYNASLNPLSQPPSKGLILAGGNVKRMDGSTIDLRGGGDLQAMEWIQGKGGSRDTLTTTPSGQTVYALVPSANTAAAYDIQFATAHSLDNGKTVVAGDTNPLVGTQITIAGGNGIPAGTYTLYPAHYATLPGAYRVTYYGSNVGRNLTSGTTLPDGTVLVTGNTTQSTAPGKQSSGQTLFAVQSNAVWQQYSEYKFNGANSFFTQLAAKNNVVAPALPMDAGRLSVIAQQSILLNGIALTQPGQDSSGNTGRGSQLDISSTQAIDVVGHTQYANNDIPTGYLGIDVTQLTGFESILIGGKRTDTSTGTLITPAASSILVDTRGEVFTAPEILLVATTTSASQTVPQNLTVSTQSLDVEQTIVAPAANSGTVTIASGSVIKTTGIVHTGAGRNYFFATPPAGGTTTAQALAAALGGTLDASGTVITGVDVSKFSYFAKNADGSFVTNPDGTIYHHVGTLSSSALALLQNYAYQVANPGLGALFVASNDSTLKVSGPTAVAAPSLTIQFASSTDPKVSGSVGGSLLLPADAGRVAIAAGANITTKALTLQATASKQAIVVNSNDLHVGQLNITAQTIGLGSSSVLTDKSVALYDRQFADVGALSLKALSGTITLYGNFDPGQGVSGLTLDAGAVVRADGTGNAQISDAGTITLLNSGGAVTPTTSPAASGSLSFSAQDIVLGSGALTSGQTILGYSQVNLNASDRLLVAGPGGLTLGAGTDSVDLNIATPLIQVVGASGANGASFAATTQGNITVTNSFAQAGIADRPADSAETGGNLLLKAANVTMGSTIQAQAGTITLEATTGNVTLNQRAYLDAGGFKKTLVDIDTYLSGGKIVLQADQGSIATDALSVVDVAQPAGGIGYGGEIDVTATSGNATLQGFLRGSGGPGHGGSFKLNIKGAADLTALADKLLAGGVTGAIDIHTRTGNLVLAENHTLKANAITLTADDTNWVAGDVNQQFGQIYIGGLLDASGYGGWTGDGVGQAGGQVGIYAANSVTLGGASVIDASTVHADERGGDVTVGIGWGANGKIFLQQGLQIDVSGGTKGGLSGGTVTFKAPRDGNNDMKLAVLSAVRNGKTGAFDELATIDGIHIVGARSVSFDDFVSFDTVTSQRGLNGSVLGWNGNIDPAGWFLQDGKTLATSGTWSDVAGWQITQVTNNSAGYQTAICTATSVCTVTLPANSGLGGTGATVLMTFGIKTFNAAAATGFTVNAGQTLSVTFPTDGNGTTVATPATGTVKVGANGAIDPSSLVITSPGSGYGRAPTSMTVITGTDSSGKPTSQTVGLASGSNQSSLQILSARIGSMGTGYTAPTSDSLSTLSSANFQLTVGSLIAGQSTVTFTEAFGSGAYSVQNGKAVFTPDQSNFIPFQASGVFSLFDPTKQNTPGVANFTGSNAAGTSQNFFSSVLTQVTQGTWSNNGQSYGFGNLFNRLQPLVGELGASVVHVTPGVQLVNSQGDITVVSNWNLASGTAGNLKTATNPVTGTTFQYYDPNVSDPTSSYVAFNYRLVTPWNTVEAGDLTLRTAGNVNVNASISDGFFQFGNYLDPTYVAAVLSYLRGVDGASSVKMGNFTFNGVALGNRTFANDYTYYLNGSGAVPIAPYLGANNGVSPRTQDLAASDLFPGQLNVCISGCSPGSTPRLITVTAPSSWSYTVTAGAELASANPAARVSLTNAGGKGSVIVSNHASYNQPLVDNSTTGSTDFATFVTVNLPTMVRTGTGNVEIAAAQSVTMADTTAPGVIYAAGVNSAKIGQDFLEPQVLGYGNGGATTLGSSIAPIQAGLLPYYGPPTAAAFPVMGGDVTVDAQQDIIGYSGTGNKVVQYYQPWLMADAGFATNPSATFGAGVFAPSGASIASQTAWWIQYGSFQQGILSAGGNVNVAAGRDLIDVSVSLPTTGRVSGGLSATSTPVTHLYGSGNMSVRAGRNILGGSFYEGSGHASIVAGNAAGQNGTVSAFATSTLKLPDYPLLAVDTGQIEMVAGGAITVAGVVNPAELQTQRPSLANPLETTATASNSLYMDTYGPDSKVRLVAETGDLTISIAPTAVGARSANINSTAKALPAASMYPASFEALALSGNLVTTGLQFVTTTGVSIPTPGIVLSPSDHGTFELLAQGSVDLTFNYGTVLSSWLNTAPSNRTFNLPSIPMISAGSSLIDTAFDPFQPDSGYDGSSSKALLAHADDAQAGVDATARIYAATGDINAVGSYGKGVAGNNTNNDYQRIELNRPTKVFAGRDLVDLNIIVQNIHPSDVSTIEAGRDITYTGNNNAGGLQVAGPGFLVVQAGRNIGPFLPLADDNPQFAPVQEGIVSVGIASTRPVGDIYVSQPQAQGGGSVGIYDQALFGPFSHPRRNTQLTDAAGTRQGASLEVLFGTKFGVDYQAMINAYIDPANAANVDHNYVPDLQAFLQQIGKPASSSDPATVCQAFNALPKDLQQVFVDQVFFAELKAVAISKQQTGTADYPRGEIAVNTMFPASFGYTSNALGSGTESVNTLVKIGDLNLYHATIQTQFGGDVSIFGPGGSLNVGPLSTEPNPKLKLRDLGILTLGSGNINTFTDENVSVNSSRVLTTFGGDVLMWSSNGDLDAGRGSKTIVSAPALQTVFDQNDYESIDPGGYVTGSGIGTVQASSSVPPGQLYLLTPRGVIDFGTAGVRASGNAVFAAPVILNSSNYQVQGTTTGLPVIAVPNLGALTSASNTAGAAAKPAETPTTSGGNRDQASIFIVEVVSYGGGDQSQSSNGGDSQNQPSTGGDRRPDAQTTDEKKKR